MKFSFTIQALVIFSLFYSCSNAVAQRKLKSAQVLFTDGSIRDGFIKKSVSDSSIFLWSTPTNPGVSGNYEIPSSTIRSISLPPRRLPFVKRTLTGLGGGTVMGLIIGSTIYDSDEDASWLENSFDERMRAVAWGASIGAVTGLIWGIFTKESDPIQLIIGGQNRFTQKQKRKLDAVSF